MAAPPIISGFTPAALVPYILAAATAWLFWTRVVPHQLRGLQVAFETGEKRYEVHEVTSSIQDARDLLRSRGMQPGCCNLHFRFSRCPLAVFRICDDSVRTFGRLSHSFVKRGIDFHRTTCFDLYWDFSWGSGG